MPTYETTFVVNPQADDSAIEREVRAIADLITNNNGKILYEDRVGTRRLAYEIEGLTQGYYTTLIYEAPADVLPKLQRHFRLGEAYLRYLTVLCERNLEKLLEPPQSEAPAKKKEESPARTEPEKPAEEKTPEPSPAEPAPPPEEPSPEKAEEKPREEPEKRPAAEQFEEEEEL